MKLAPDDQAAVKEALRAVVDRAVRASTVGDLDAAITELMSTRDAIIGAAITIRAVADKTRSNAMEHA